MCTFFLGCRNVVIRRGKDRIHTPRLATSKAQTIECLRRRHFMDDMAIDIDKRGAIVALLHEVGIPKFVVKRFRGHGESPMSACTVFIWIIRHYLIITLWQ